jgi:hypothetical protein
MYIKRIYIPKVGLISEKLDICTNKLNCISDFCSGQKLHTYVHIIENPELQLTVEFNILLHQKATLPHMGMISLGGGDLFIG